MEKELEVLYTFNNTYLKEIENKCKISIIKNYKKEDFEFRFYILMCGSFTNYVKKGLPNNKRFFSPSYAIKLFKEDLKVSMDSVTMILDNHDIVNDLMNNNNLIQ